MISSTNHVLVEETICFAGSWPLSGCPNQLAGSCKSIQFFWFPVLLYICLKLLFKYFKSECRQCIIAFFIHFLFGKKERKETFSSITGGNESIIYLPFSEKRRGLIRDITCFAFDQFILFHTHRGTSCRHKVSPFQVACRNQVPQTNGTIHVFFC